MPTNIIVNFQKLDKRFTVIMTDEELTAFDDRWESDDRFLSNLREEIPHIFEGLNKWNELRPIHFAILVVKNLTQLMNLSEEEQKDEEHPVSKSLYFLISGLVKSLGTRTDAAVEVIRIHYFDEQNVALEYQLTMGLGLGERPLPKLSLVVDND
jgi:hypothetical protein